MVAIPQPSRDLLVRPVLVPAFIVLVDRYHPYKHKVGVAGARQEVTPAVAATAAAEGVALPPHPHGPLRHAR